ncbi:DUF5666 domain-containing protein [Methylorubrum sp. POS3]|uniref:DUF5666 domain-containing protein n=1 Tax=Methylorubrum sp. POS3 TaxID=2998492 RepID=UPI0037269270
MSRPSHPTRRGLLALLAVTALGWQRPARGQTGGEAPQDRGIGGTGARPDEAELPSGDRGIGGTGVIGTIRRFGSIVVNGLRIAYPPDVRVTIDGRAARAADLRIGHVVRVVARGPDGGLTTRAIAVTSEVVGPIEASAPGRLTVLGQAVSTAGLPAQPSFAVGTRVAVSGQRRGDGAIVASLIEPRPDGPDRVAGPARRGADGTMRIGGLVLEGLKTGLAGRRVLVEGQPTGAGFSVTSARDLSRPFPGGLARASVEGYVVPGGGGTRLGSGLTMAGRAGPQPGAGPTVVEAGLARDGRMRAEAVRGDGAPRSGTGPAGTGQPGGARPEPGPAGGRPGGDAAPSLRPGGRDPSGGSVGPGRGGAGPGFGPGGYPIDTRPAPGQSPGGFGSPAPGGFDGPSGIGGARPGGFGRGGPGGFGGGPGSFGGGGGPGGFGGGGPR